MKNKMAEAIKTFKVAHPNTEVVAMQWSTGFILMTQEAFSKLSKAKKKLLKEE